MVYIIKCYCRLFLFSCIVYVIILLCNKSSTILLMETDNFVFEYIEMCMSGNDKAKDLEKDVRKSI